MAVIIAVGIVDKNNFISWAKINASSSAPYLEVQEAGELIATIFGTKPTRILSKLKQRTHYKGATPLETFIHTITTSRYYDEYSYAAIFQDGTWKISYDFKKFHEYRPATINDYMEYLDTLGYTRVMNITEVLPDDILFYPPTEMGEGKSMILVQDAWQFTETVRPVSYYIQIKGIVLVAYGAFLTWKSEDIEIYDLKIRGSGSIVGNMRYTYHVYRRGND